MENFEIKRDLLYTDLTNTSELKVGDFICKNSDLDQFMKVKEIYDENIINVDALASFKEDLEEKDMFYFFKNKLVMEDKILNFDLDLSNDKFKKVTRKDFVEISKQFFNDNFSDENSELKQNLFKLIHQRYDLDTMKNVINEISKIIEDYNNIYSKDTEQTGHSTEYAITHTFNNIIKSVGFVIEDERFSAMWEATHPEIFEDEEEKEK